MKTGKRLRLPITWIAVVGVGGLVGLAVSIALLVGLGRATQSTNHLFVSQSSFLIDAIEDTIDAQLRPVTAQANWIARQVASGELDITDVAALDKFMLGAFAATPQVAGIAIVSPAGQSRRDNSAVNEDWSSRQNILDWLEFGAQDRSHRWREPIWTDTIKESVLLHDIPLYHDDIYLGMLGQIVPVGDLSRHISRAFTDSGMTPFILYDHGRVLAHPLLISRVFDGDQANAPLLTIRELGDVVLERIWQPDESDMFLMKGLENAQAVGNLFNDDYFLYLYREVAHYGPTPWVVGLYFNASTHGGGEFESLMQSLAIGFAVLLVSVLCAVVVGRRFSLPIEQLAQATSFVEAGDLEQVPDLGTSHVRELDDAARSFNLMVEGLREGELIRHTLGRFVPREVALDLLASGGSISPEQLEATVLFADLEKFSQLTEELGPAGIVSVLNEYFSAMVEILEEHQGVVTQFQGDAILATFNVPITNSNHATNAVNAAVRMLTLLQNRTFTGRQLNARIGVSTGSLVAGAVGAVGRLSYTVHGDAVNQAARLESMNKEHGTRLLVSAATVNQTTGFDLRVIGEAAVRGQSQPVTIHTIDDVVAAAAAVSLKNHAPD